MTSLIRFADASECANTTGYPDHGEAIESIRARLVRNWESDSVEARLALLANLIYLTHQQAMSLHRK
ncbi:hypothetical protein ACFQZQ_12500 [Lysobacter koreensis]|uniref:Uncharacterized protein n=1 Tax=Lysobacter koreensis TaxID=266122 RepID=A0ABW2YQC5_9GAMM